MLAGLFLLGCEGSLLQAPWLQTASFSLCLHMVLPLHFFCAQISL